MESIFYLLAKGWPVLVIVMFVIIVNLLNRPSRSRGYIQNYRFPNRVPVMLREKYTHLTDEDVADVLAALKQYFLMCRERGSDMVSMPSKVVDVAWHEFILFTRDYEQFCRFAFGRFLHHIPAEAMGSNELMCKGLERAWRWSCLSENIDLTTPSRLPSLFAIDERLSIPGGNFYALDSTYIRIGERKGVSGGSKYLSCGGEGCGGGCGCGG